MVSCSKIKAMEKTDFSGSQYSYRVESVESACSRTIVS